MYKISSDKIFHLTKLFVRQNFPHPAKISTILSDEFLNDKVIQLPIIWKIRAFIFNLLMNLQELFNNSDQRAQYSIMLRMKKLSELCCWEVKLRNTFVWHLIPTLFQSKFEGPMWKMSTQSAQTITNTFLIPKLILVRK